METLAKIVVRDLAMDYERPRRGSAGRTASGGAPVLQHINLTVAAGEFVCLVGPSGCGKSTLLNLIGGFLQPTRGVIFIDGAPVKGPDPRRIFIFQENGLFPWLTVAENIGFGLQQQPPAVRAQTVARCLELIGLPDCAQAYPRELSGGMKQRVELARALAAEPDVLYMDEPFGALDFLTRMRLRAELLRIWQQDRKTVLFVTHDVEEAVQLADRVVVLSRAPASIVTTVEIALPRPRDLAAPACVQLRDQIFAAMGLDHAGLSVVPARAAVAA